MRRARVLRIVFAGLVAAILASSVVGEAFAAPSKAQLQAELNRLDDEAKRAGRAFDKAYWAYEESDVEYQRLSNKMAKLKKQLEAEQEQLSARAEAWYRSDQEGFVAVLLSSGTFNDFITRLEYMQRISSSDARAIESLEKTLAEVRTTRAALDETRADRARDMKALKKKRDALQAKLAKAQKRYNEVSKQLAKTSPIRGAKAVAGPNGMVFPVAGPNYYSDTWGASRGGGRRRHKGTDIMARTGTPCVATMSGTVTVKSGSTAGLWINLRADNGWQFWYMHLSKVAVRSGRVRAGQVIGYVGYSGNATASAPHLHYEIHPNGGAAVNPYPYLREMQGR